MRGWGWIPLAVIAAVLVIVGIVGCNIVVHQKHTAVTTICSKEAVAEKEGHTYRVYTTSQGTLTVSDSHWPTTWRTNSSEVFGKLHTPGTYRITYFGVRNSLFSWFHNLLKAERLPDDKAEIAKC